MLGNAAAMSRSSALSLVHHCPGYLFERSRQRLRNDVLATVAEGQRPQVGWNRDVHDIHVDGGIWTEDEPSSMKASRYHITMDHGQIHMVTQPDAIPPLYAQQA